MADDIELFEPPHPIEDMALTWLGWKFGNGSDEFSGPFVKVHDHLMREISVMTILEAMWSDEEARPTIATYVMSRVKNNQPQTSETGQPMPPVLSREGQ